MRKLRHEAVLGQGIDLVVGHHAHVVQGIEIVDGRVIFYGLGNFLHPGMQNMAGMGSAATTGCSRDCISRLTTPATSASAPSKRSH